MTVWHKNWEYNGKLNTFLVNCYPTSICLHGFSDASECAYAAVLYLSSTYADNCTEVLKTRVSPTKRQSIPQLEILGALILARLVSSLNGFATKGFGYVQHCVNEIRESTDTSYWKYCPGRLNPADLPSRGLRAKDLLNNPLWWNGPDFIARYSSHQILIPTLP